MRPKVAAGILIGMGILVPGLLYGQDSGPLSKLSVHGFLTQAYADAKFSTGGLFPPDR